MSFGCNKISNMYNNFLNIKGSRQWYNNFLNIKGPRTTGEFYTS
jgi:hypothetical protein